MGELAPASFALPLRRPFTFSNIFETTGPIKLKFNMETP